MLRHPASMMPTYDSPGRQRGRSRDGGIPAYRELGGSHHHGPRRYADSPLLVTSGERYCDGMTIDRADSLGFIWQSRSMEVSYVVFY